MKKSLVISSVVVTAIVVAGVFWVKNKQDSSLSFGKILENNKDLFDGHYKDTGEYKSANIDDWQLYKNEELGFEMMIPQDWICKHFDIDEIKSEELMQKLEKSKAEGVRTISCFNSKAKKSDNFRDIQDDSITIVYPAKKSPYLYKKKESRAHFALLKKIGTKNYLTEIDKETANLAYRSRKEDGSMSSVEIITKHNENFLTIFIVDNESTSDDFISTSSKSVIDTFKFID
jgi:hypothetical protein